jgi:very-short-patch-repair endonuclease
MIENEKLNGETLHGRVGDVERLCLNELQKYTNFEILRNRQLIGYIPDGFIKELNLVIEFDERHHFIDNYETYCEHDIQKNKDLKEKNFKIFRIKRNIWEQNKKLIIDQFIKFLGE